MDVLSPDVVEDVVVVMPQLHGIVVMPQLRELIKACGKLGHCQLRHTRDKKEGIYEQQPKILIVLVDF